MQYEVHVSLYVECVPVALFLFSSVILSFLVALYFFATVLVNKDEY